MTSPTLPAQAGLGRQRLDAAASANSALVSLVSEHGRACSHAEDTLSRCLQAQAALVLRGRTWSSDLPSKRALVFSTVSIIFPLVAPDTQPSPKPSRGVASTPS